MIVGQFICQVIYKNQEQNGSNYDTFAWAVAAKFHFKSFVLKKPLHSWGGSPLLPSSWLADYDTEVKGFQEI